jgi:hypothetical protein
MSFPTTTEDQTPVTAESNPYSAPEATSVSTTPTLEAPPPVTLPRFCKGFFIADLVFCVLRLLIVLLGVAAFATLGPEEAPDAPSFGMEVITGLAIAVFGISGNILLLNRQRWAVVFGYLCVGATVASILVGVWGAVLGAQEIGGNTPELAGFVVGAGFSVMLRLALLGMYIVALAKFSAWFKANEEALLGSGRLS